MEPIQLKLEAFEGPLDLLLHLTKKMEVDLHDIPIAEITKQYMEHLHSWQEENLEIAGEYLVMASTLLAIKSNMLLPTQMCNEKLDEEELLELDPRGNLEKQLVEYRTFKEISETLQEFELKRSDYFTKEAMSLEEYTKKQIKLEPNRYTTISLYLAFHEILAKQAKRRPVQTKIKKETISIEDRMKQISLRLRRMKAEGKNTIFFDELLAEDSSKSEIIMTFLAMLELMRKRQLEVWQENNYCQIAILWR
jgi:segregation and condensation protein A